MLEHEAEQLGKSGPTDEEIKKKSEVALRSANRTTERGVIMAVAYAAPLMTHSQRIYQSIETATQKCKQKGEALVLEEAKQLTKEVQNVMGFSDLSEVDFSAINEVDIPTVACIMASAFAPAQLNLLYAINKLFFICSLLFLLLDVVVLIFDWHTPCMGKPIDIPPRPSLAQIFNIWWADALDNHIYLWFLADAMVHLSCLLVRIPVIYNVKVQLDVLDRQQRHPREVFMQEGGEDDVRDTRTAVKDLGLVLKRLLEYYMTTGFATMQRLDRVLRSYWVFLANFSIVFDVFWIAYGTFLVWNTPWFACADVGIVILRLRSTIFLILLAFYLLQLSLFCMGQLMQSDSFSVQVIHVGDSIDEAMQLGLPLFKVIFHALVVRHSSDMIAIQVNIHRLEKQRLIQKRTARMAQLEELNRALESSDQLIDSLEYKNAMNSRAFKDHAAIQEEVNKMKEQYKEDSFKFSKKVAGRIVDATKKAEGKIEEWQHGEGPSLLTAIHGEGLTAAASMMNHGDSLDNVFAGAQELNATLTAVTESAVEQAQIVAEMTPEQIGQGLRQADIIAGESTGSSTSEIARLLEQARSSADVAAGGEQGNSSIERRLSQPDEGAGR
jgi:hypothetical protein